MGKVDEIIKILSFYSRVNTLKEATLDEQNNYSIASQLFGSMILATAINSEYKEADDLSKIYRMLFLSEFNKQYPNYDFGTFKLGEQYIEEIAEAKDTKSYDGKLVYKYKMLDSLLTRIIIEKENKVSPSQLIKEGSSIISSLCDIQPVKCEEIFKFYHSNFKLKNKMRSAWDNKHWNVKSDKIETIADHIIGVFALAVIMYSENNYNIDIDKVLETIVIHEIGEALIGDITPFDDITAEQKIEIEHKAMIEVLGNLRNKEKKLSLLYEFDERKTPEAKFTYYCDKMEADLQAKIYQDKGLHHSLDEQSNNCVFKYPEIQEMLKQGASTAFDIWYEWDKNRYAGDNDFPEFSNMLEIVRMCNLMNLIVDKKENNAPKRKIMQILKKQR